MGVIITEVEDVDEGVSLAQRAGSVAGANAFDPLQPIVDHVRGIPTQGVFGSDPTDPRYGTRPLPVGGTLDGGGVQGYYHDYLDPMQDHVSVQNIARVVAGLPPGI
jgi:hypothetical protein